MPAVFYLLLGFFLLSLSCASAAEKRVRIGVYQNLITQFPNRNGLYWMHGVAHGIFLDAGYKAMIISRPAERLTLSLSNNEVDLVYDFEDSLGKFNNEFIGSKFPATLAPVYIYYDHRKNWQPTWPPDVLFKQKIGRSVHSSVSLRDLNQLNVGLATSFDAPVKMVNMGRADYYIENVGGIMGVSKGLFKTPAQGFSLKLLYQKPIYGYFQNTKRGKRLASIYDREILLLFQRGEYGRKYFANAPIYNGSQNVDDAVAFINKNYPSLNIPEQPSGKVAPAALEVDNIRSQ